MSFAYYLPLSIVALNQECYYSRTRAEGLNPKISKWQGWPHKLFPNAYHWDHTRFLETAYKTRHWGFTILRQEVNNVYQELNTHYSKKFKTQTPHTNHVGLRFNKGIEQKQVWQNPHLYWTYLWRYRQNYRCRSLMLVKKHGHYIRTKLELRKHSVCFRSTSREVSRKNNKPLQNKQPTSVWRKSSYLWALLKILPVLLMRPADSSKLCELLSISAFVHFEVCLMQKTLTPVFLPLYTGENWLYIFKVHASNTL